MGRLSKIVDIVVLAMTFYITFFAIRAMFSSASRSVAFIDFEVYCTWTK